MVPSAAISEHRLAAFHRDGYLVLPGVLQPAEIEAVCEFVRASLEPLVGPVEYEADVGYPGSPSHRKAAGGNTPRRLLHAYARDQILRNLALHPQVASVLNELLGAAGMLSQCHHNCVMTKHPGYSSATLWHQDIRYWSFDRPELISAWFALGEERFSNGALQVIAGTHLMEFERGRLDAELFLRPEIEENAKLIEQARSVELNPGDVLLFHCRLFHAAGRNTTDEVKLSPVFTYHREDNHPIPGTRSAAYPSIPLPGG
jgi:phytanoyl-CoA hydroxylase